MTKRWVKLLLPLVVSLFLFWRPLFETSCGWAVRAFLAHHDWHLTFKSMKWNGEGFVFTDVTVEAPDIFLLNAEKVDLSLKRKMIEIETPHLSMYKWEFDDDWPDWKISMRNGTLRDDLIGEAQFFMERIHPDQMARVVFERNGSQLALEGLKEGESTRILAEWKSLDLKELNQWIEVGQFSKGKSEGSGQILLKKEGKTELKAHWNVKDASYAYGPWKGEEVTFECNWEGPLCFSPDCKIRAELDRARFTVGEKSFEIAQGHLSSFPGVGAKIELRSHSPWSFQLRTGFGEAPWVEAEMKFSKASVSLKSSSWECKEIGPSEVAFFQALASPFFSEIAEASFDQGLIHAKGTWSSENWSLKELKAQRVKISQEKFALAFDSFHCDKENVTFEGASFQTPYLEGLNWEGKSSFEKGVFSGVVNGSDLQIELLEKGVAQLKITGQWDGTAKLLFDWENGHLCTEIKEGNLGAEFSNLKFQNLGMKFLIGKEDIHCYDLRGEWADIPFFIPHFAVGGNFWAFDFRLEGQGWDLLRLWGTADKGSIHFDPTKSHILGSPLQITSCVVGSEKFKNLHLETTIHLNLLEAAASLLREKGMISPEWDFSSLEGRAAVSIHLEEGGNSHIAIKGKEVFYNQSSFPIDLFIRSDLSKEWEILRCQIGDWSGKGKFIRNGLTFEILEGFCKSKKVQAQFEGVFTPEVSGAAQMVLSRAQIFLPEQDICATLKGKGHYESNRLDLEIQTSDIKLGKEVLKNREDLQICYSKDKGLLVRGIDLYNSRWIGKIGLLQYEAAQSRWIANHSQISIPAEFISSFKSPFPLSIEKNIEIIADLEWNSDFSLFQGKVKEGFFSVAHSMHHISDLKFKMGEKKIDADFHWFYEGSPLIIGLSVDWTSQMGGILRLYDEEKAKPLVVEWGFEEESKSTVSSNPLLEPPILEEKETPLSAEQKVLKEKRFSLYRVEGKFKGIDASFYRESDGGLVGSVGINFSLLENFLPPQIRQLHLGSGYELKGKFLWGENGPSFQGILAGKEIEILGYRFRTLLGQVSCMSDRFEVSHFKLSDSAGMVQIAKMTGTRLPEESWKIEMPQLLLQELRPSLLQKIGKDESPMSPLIIRELNLMDFEGIVGKSNTYRSHGSLSFINSYRRMRTMYDLPADVLGLLVGLDQELMIPARGTIQFDMKEGRIHLLGLEEAFSQGNRSQFFLVDQDEGPYIDLDGHLHILIKMKQFVIFKFTEFFLISIEGTMDSPQIHLQKKKGFFGL